MHKLPMRKVNENLEMFLTHAIGISMLHMQNAMYQIHTSMPVKVFMMLWADTVMYDTKLNEKDSCVKAIIISTKILPLGPSALRAINEYEVSPSFLPTYTSFMAHSHCISPLMIKIKGENMYPPLKKLFGKTKIISAQYPLIRAM